MDDTKLQKSWFPDHLLDQLFLSSNCSTLSEALTTLIEVAKTSAGRSDLASKHILVPVLKLCQSPFQLSDQEFLLSMKLLRNLCAGEIENQDLFIGQNGVNILSAIISSMGLTSGSEIMKLRMVLQVLANVSLAGEEHRVAVWRHFFPAGFLDISRVRIMEICDPLCMIIYSCTEGNPETFSELLSDQGLDILLEVLRTVTIVGFKEDWAKLLLSKICLDESYFSTIFHKLCPTIASQNSHESASQITRFGAEQAAFLRILSEIVNDRVEDIAISKDFSLWAFKILQDAVGNVDFTVRGDSSLPTGASIIDVVGYSLSILRDICACDQSTKGDSDTIDILVSAGLIKFVITLLRDLELPTTVRKAVIHSESQNGAYSNSSKRCPYKGFRSDIVAVIGNCSYRRKHVQDEVREENGILLLLQQCVLDEDNPFLREWGFWSIRNVLEGNIENQHLVSSLEVQGSVDTPEITELGLRVEVDPQTRRAKLVNSSRPL